MTIGISFKAEGGVRLPPARSFWVQVGVSGWEEITAPSGIWYASKSFVNNDNLIPELDSLIAASDPGHADLNPTITDEGYFELQNARDDGRSYQLTFEDPGGPSASDSLELRNALGVERDRVIITVPAGLGPSLPGKWTSTNQPPFNLLPKQYFFAWSPLSKVKAAQARSKSGRVRTLKLAENHGVDFEVGIEQAWPHQDGWSEWHSLRQFMDYASQGLPFRLFPDKDNANAHVPPWAYRMKGDPDFVLEAVTANPNGYLELQLDRDSWDWNPDTWGDDGGEFSRFRQAFSAWFFREGLLGSFTTDAR